MKVLQRYNLNFEAAVMTGISILALLIAAAKPWWRLLGYTEPLYFKLDRLICLVLAVVVAYCVLTVRKYRVTALLTVGMIALLLPFVTVFCLVSLDAPRIETAVEQFNTTASIIASSKQLESNIEVPWTDDQNLSQYSLTRNDYTISDAIATTFHYVLAGFLVALVAGICLILTGWVMNAPAAAISMRKVGARAAVAVAVIVIVVSIPGSAGFIEWNLGRKYQALGQYNQALIHYRRAATFDKRIDYDIFFHYNLGRMDAALRRRDDPDFWAFMGDTFWRGGSLERGAFIYEAHIPDPNANPALAYRYSRIMFSAGDNEYNKGSYAMAIRHLTESLEFNPSSVQTAYSLAYVETANHDYPTAIKEWKSIIINNESVGMYRSKYFTSNVVYRKALTGRCWSHLAWCYYQMHDYRDAMASLVNSDTGGQMPLPKMDNSPIQPWTHS